MSFVSNLSNFYFNVICDFVPFLICPQSRDLGHYQWPNSWTGLASQLKSEPKQMLYFVKIWRILGTGG